MFSRLFLCSGSIYFGENNSNGALGAPLCGARLIPHHTHYTRKMYTVVPQWCPELLKSYGKQRGAIKRYCRYSSISLLFFFAFFDVSCPASFPVLLGISGKPPFEVGVVGSDMDKGVFLVKPYIGGLFLFGKPCSHANSFLRPCYRVGAFFGCFPRLLTWVKRRF